jgi:hypothetical protein
MQPDTTATELPSLAHNPTPGVTPPKVSGIFFATPCYGGQVFHSYLSSFVRLTAGLCNDHIPFSTHFVANESHINRARNNIVAAFMKNEWCSHLMFIDADVGFEAESIGHLILSDKDIVCGSYPKKSINWGEVVANVKDGTADENNAHEFSGHHVINIRQEDHDAGKAPIYNGNLLRVRDAGTGFMMIKRHVFTKMFEAYPELAYNSDSDTSKGEQVYHLFDDILVEGEHEGKRCLSEDYGFCRRWQKIGGEIYINLDVKLTHTGTHIFTGDVNRYVVRD